MVSLELLGFTVAMESVGIEMASPVMAGLVAGLVAGLASGLVARPLMASLGLVTSILVAIS